MWAQVGCLSEDSRRLRVEELLRPVLKVGGPTAAPLPLWTWIEHGSVPAVEALLRNTEQAARSEGEKPRFGRFDPFRAF